MWLQHHGQKHSTGEQTAALFFFFLNLRFIKETQHSPSFDFFFRARVPPNFPRKDSSFFILVDCVVAEVPDIFQTWCVCVLSLSLSLSFSLSRPLILSLLPVMHSGTDVRSNQARRRQTNTFTGTQQSGGGRSKAGRAFRRTDWLTHTGPCESTASSASMFTVGSPHSAPQRYDAFTDPHWTYSQSSV